jgi:hypothetical protein
VGGDPVGQGQTAHVCQVLHQVPDSQKYPQCDVIRSYIIDDPTNTGSQKQGYTVIRFVSISSKLGICTVLGLNGTLVENQIHTFNCLTFVF